MSESERWRRIERVLDAALAQEPARWPALLDAECADDADLRGEVESLLGRYRTARGFLQSPPVTAAAALVSEVREALDGPLDGRRVGPYRIVREIGSGGMARVFLAERDDGEFAQRVALKLLRGELDSDVHLARFRAERQILASLNHPNVARLLDGGVTDDGRPYLVMELVDGLPIDRWCAERALTPDERVALFRRVIEATEYAHRNLVVHRDLKPSNILVTRDGVPKLLDFGIAKLLDGESDAPTPMYTPPKTRAGHAWMTPEYAAPEQVRGDAVTTLTDVYQLGAVLYELLAGRPPFGAARNSLHALQDAVLHDEPPAPSTVAESPAVRRALRGDLDAIVLKALRKEPEARYVSASAMLDDLQRTHDGRPVLARADGTWYRARRFIVRHRGPVIAATLAVALLAAGGFRERALRRRAEAEAKRALAVERYLASVFDVADPFAPPNDHPEEVTARALLDRGAAHVDSALRDQPEAQADLRVTLGKVYGSLGLYDRAVPLLRRALEQQRALHGARHPAVAEVMDRLGQSLASLDQYDEAERLLGDALAQRRALLGAADTATASSMDHLATLLQQRGKYEPAEALFREALATRRAALGDSSIPVANSYTNLGLLRYTRGDYAETYDLYSRALAIQQRTLGPNHPETAITLHNLAQLQDGRGELAAAEALYRRALAAKRKSLGDLHPSVTINMNNLAQLLAREGKLDEADSLARAALALDRRMFGERHVNVAESLANLALVLRRKGDLDEAERTYREALAIHRALHGGDNTYIANHLNNLGNIHLAKGDAAGALALYAESYAMYAKLLGTKHRSAQVLGVRYAAALRDAGRLDTAERTYRAQLALADTTGASGRSLLAEGLTGLGRTLIAERRAAEACPSLAHALATARALPRYDRWRTAEARLALGQCLTATGDRVRAAPLLRDAADSLRVDRRAQPHLAALAEAAQAASGRPR